MPPLVEVLEIIYKETMLWLYKKLFSCIFFPDIVENLYNTEMVLASKRAWRQYLWNVLSQCFPSSGATLARVGAPAYCMRKPGVAISGCFVRLGTAALGGRGTIFVLGSVAQVSLSSDEAWSNTSQVQKRNFPFHRSGNWTNPITPPSPMHFLVW